MSKKSSKDEREAEEDEDMDEEEIDEEEVDPDALLDEEDDDLEAGWTE